MSLILDARGNEFQGQLDGIGGQVFNDARVAGATLGVLNAELIMDLNGKSIAMFDVRTAAANLTIVFEATIDGTNYFGLSAFANQQNIAGTLIQEQYVPSVTITTTATGFYTIEVGGFRRVRCRVSAYTSGNVIVTARSSVSDHIIYTRPLPTTLIVSATAAANTNAVATLLAAGAGMFHYITSIQITRNATAALAGTATLVHTTSNLPGTLAWSVGNAMAAGGTQVDVDLQPSNPIRSSVANTNTVITAVAAGAGVLARVNVTYYVGY
jgi:hypothetical protein